MVVNEHKSCVSEHFRKVRELLFPVENFRRMSSISTDVVDGSDAHEASDDKSEHHGHYLEWLRILDVTEGKVDGEHRKNCDPKVVGVEM